MGSWKTKKKKASKDNLVYLLLLALYTFLLIVGSTFVGVVYGWGVIFTFWGAFFVIYGSIGIVRQKIFNAMYPFWEWAEGSNAIYVGILYLLAGLFILWRLGIPQL